MEDYLMNIAEEIERLHSKQFSKREQVTLEIFRTLLAQHGNEIPDEELLDESISLADQFLTKFNTEEILNDQEASNFNTGVILKEKELATVLAALRVVQDHPEPMEGMPHFNDVGEPLDEAEIDDLCERLN